MNNWIAMCSTDVNVLYELFEIKYCGIVTNPIFGGTLFLHYKLKEYYF